MKIRNGFVSNSSSSSFIVAFEKVPRTVESMVKMLYGPAAKENDIIEMYGYTMTKGHAAKQVLDDIKRKDSKIDREDLIREFSGRYHTPYNLEDAFGAMPRTDPTTWYGLNYDTMMEMWNNAITVLQEREKIDRKIKTYINKKIGERPSYGSEASDRWYTEYEKLKEEDEEYKKLDEERMSTLHKDWEKEDFLLNKAAEADVDGFLKDNEGCKIRHFEYSDNDGNFFTLMEHSGVFRRLPHVEISHH